MTRSASKRTETVAQLHDLSARRAEVTKASALAAAAVVIGVQEEGVLVQRRRDSAELSARLALLVGYVPAVDDEVLVAESDVGPVVIAVLRTSSPLVLSGPRDVILRAPSGSVRVEAGIDVAIAAARDATVSGARRSTLEVTNRAEGESAEGSDVAIAPRVAVEQKGVTVAGPSVEARAKRVRLVSAGADVIAQTIRTSAATIETRARKIDITAETMVRRAKEVLDQVSGLVETRAGRVRSFVTGAFSLRSKTTALKSEKDTSVDGRRVLLG